MINLLPSQLQINPQAEKYKKLIWQIATVVLTVYVVLVAASGGWWLWLATRQTTASAEVVDLTSQVGQLVKVEAVVRQVDSRIKLVNGALAAREDGSSMAAVLSGSTTGVSIAGWEYAEKGGQTVTVESTKTGPIESYIDYLKQKYKTATLVSLSREVAGVWGGKIHVE